MGILVRKNKFKKIKGFTLAEVLITLGIIGIVAEITIPTLYSNFVKQQYVTLSQKAYSQSAQFFKTYMAQQGINDLSSTDLGDRNNLDIAVRNYFKVMQVCKDSGDTSCQVTEKYLSKTTATPVNFTTNSTSALYNYSFITADGIEYEYRIALNSGAPCNASPVTTGKMQKICGRVTFDVNGRKGPNTYGRDAMSYFLIAQDGNLYPMGGHDESYAYTGADSDYWGNNSNYCGSPSSSDMSNGGNGVFGYCLSRIMENGWVMDY